MLTPAQPSVAEANQLDARFTHQLGRAPSLPLHPTEVPRSPRAVMGAWERSKDGLPTLSTVALLDGEGRDRYTVQLTGAVEHLPDPLVEDFYGTLSIGLLNHSW